MILVIRKLTMVLVLTVAATATALVPMATCGDLTPTT